jgi:hypothetical protein
VDVRGSTIGPHWKDPVRAAHPLSLADLPQQLGCGSGYTAWRRAWQEAGCVGSTHRIVLANRRFTDIERAHSPKALASTRSARDVSTWTDDAAEM